MNEHCQCPACYAGVLHASDCAVHSMPASPTGPCNCGAIDRFAWLQEARTLVDNLLAAERGDSDEAFAVAYDALHTHLEKFVPAVGESA